MKITIEEVIKEMEEEYGEFLKGTGLDDSRTMEMERKNNIDCDKVCTANEMTLDILHRYQKIQEIIKDWENERFNDCVGCLRIRAVLRNENDD